MPRDVQVVKLNRLKGCYLSYPSPSQRMCVIQFLKSISQLYKETVLPKL